MLHIFLCLLPPSPILVTSKTFRLIAEEFLSRPDSQASYGEVLVSNLLGLEALSNGLHQMSPGRALHHAIAKMSMHPRPIF